MKNLRLNGFDFDRNPAIFEENIKYRFRNASQFTPQLANHIEIKNKTFVFNKKLRLMYFRSYKKPLLWYKFKLNYKTSNHLFLGLQSLDRCNQKILTFLTKLGNYKNISLNIHFLN